MIIEIRGTQFVNKGAELMLHAVLQKLEELKTDYLIVLRPNKETPYEKIAAIGGYQKLMLQKSYLNLNFLTYFLPKKYRNKLRKNWGIITEADVDVVLDASGFAYGDQWSSMLIRQVCQEINRLNKHGKKYIFLPQALGPFSREKDRANLQKALPNASLICAREESSYENIKGLAGDSGNYFQFPDFTNLVTGTCPEYFTDGKSKFLIIPNNKMISKQNNKSEWKETYIDSLVFLAECAREEGLEPVILNHEGEGDAPLCNTLISRLGDVKLIIEDNPLHVKGIIGASRALVCSRFHGCVSALCQGIPILGSSWSFKYERLFAEYEKSDLLITAEMDESELKASFDKLMSQTLGEDSEPSKRFKELSQQMWSKVFEVMS